jgi:hypothetical protein
LQGSSEQEKSCSDEHPDGGPGQHVGRVMHAYVDAGEGNCGREEDEHRRKPRNGGAEHHRRSSAHGSVTAGKGRRGRSRHQHVHPRRARTVDRLLQRRRRQIGKHHSGEHEREDERSTERDRDGDPDHQPDGPHAAGVGCTDEDRVEDARPMLGDPVFEASVEVAHEAIMAVRVPSQ